MYYDYHVHSSFSSDCNTAMEKTIHKAINLNMKEICFTDHVDYDYCDSSMDFDLDYDDYYKDIQNLKNKYKNDISIKMGIELGLQPHLYDRYYNDIKKYPFDFVICSIHTADKKDLYKGDIFKGISQKEGYEKYYLDLLNISKDFDNYSVIGHLDIIRRYGNFKSPLDNSLFMDIIEEILKNIISKGKGIEVNTSGFRYNLNATSPTTDVLKLYKQLNGDIITTGSDSHIPDTLSYKFKETYDILKYIGFKYICSFDNQKPSYIKIV